MCCRQGCSEWDLVTAAPCIKVLFFTSDSGILKTKLCSPHCLNCCCCHHQGAEMLWNSKDQREMLPVRPVRLSHDQLGTQELIPGCPVPARWDKTSKLVLCFCFLCIYPQQPESQQMKHLIVSLAGRLNDSYLEKERDLSAAYCKNKIS